MSETTNTAPAFTAEQLAKVLDPMHAAIGRLVCAAAGPEGNDTILSWGNGLAVRLFENEGQRKTAAVSVDRAQAFVSNGKKDFAYPVVMNGYHAVAKPMLRKDACKIQIDSLVEAIRDFSSR